MPYIVNNSLDELMNEWILRALAEQATFLCINKNINKKKLFIQYHN